MRFIDTNLFIYAVLKPKKPLPAAVAKKKTAAKEIFLRVNEGEPVMTTTVHLSEVATVLVSADDYRESIRRAQKYAVSITDALALIVMEQQGIDEIYTFDQHFTRAPVRCVQE